MRPLLLKGMLLLCLSYTCPVLAAGTSDAVTGVWRGQIDGLPGVTMTISDEAGDLSGAILFYMIRRNEGQPPQSTPGNPEPMFHMKFGGQLLDFQVSHRRAHPPRTLNDPPVTFHLKITGKDEGVLMLGNDEKNAIRVSRDK